MAPHKAHSVIKLMVQSHTEGVINFLPDVGCYQSVLVAAARRPTLPDLGPLVDSVLSEMRQRLIVPDSTCFEAAIETYRNAALLYSGRTIPSFRTPTPRPRAAGGRVNPDVTIRDRSAARALELLDEIKIARQQQNGEIVSVTTQTVNHVMEALSVSSIPNRLVISEGILFQLERGLDGNDSAMPTPDFESYRLIMEVLKGASDDGDSTLARADVILERVKANAARVADLLCSSSHDAPSRRQLRKSITSVFNSFVQVCSSVTPASDKHGLEVFKQALTGLHGLRQLRIVFTETSPVGRTSGPGGLVLFPNSESYACLLEACYRLVPSGNDRQRWVDQVFRGACLDGMVDDRVLQLLKVVAAEEQYSRLVIAESETIEGTKMVPETWTRNALGGRVVTTEGRRTTPLSVQGQLTVTLAMREYQMRRLRDHRNRKLLQGGRTPTLKERQIGR